MITTLTTIEQYLQQIDSELTTAHTPKWGLMQAQNMVEHLSLVLLLSTGKMGKDFKGDAARAAKMKANFYAVKYPFPKGVPIPGITPGKVPPLRCETMAESKALLRKSYAAFLKYYQENPTAQIPHFYFGNLSFEEWIHFQTKHFEHHLMQFGLLPYPLTPTMDAHLNSIGEKLKTVYTELTADHQAKWGLMNAHQMVEHLTLVIIYSTGKFGVPFKGDLAAAEKLWAPFEAAANPWKTVFPSFAGLGKPKPVRNETIEGSKKALKKAYAKYRHYCKENPNVITPHGFLGNITTAQWLQVHAKHIDHHLSQFGVIEELV